MNETHKKNLETHDLYCNSVCTMQDKLLCWELGVSFLTNAVHQEHRAAFKGLLKHAKNSDELMLLKLQLNIGRWRIVLVLQASICVLGSVHS